MLPCLPKNERIGCAARWVLVAWPCCILAPALPSAVGQCEIMKLVPDDGGPNFCFGLSVAVDGYDAAVGSPRTSQRGLAYVFEREGGAWSQAARFMGDGLYGLNDQFGQSVAISGNAMLVGAWSENTGGAVYAFRRHNGLWVREARFSAAETASGDRFGYSVALRGDVAVAGAPFRNAAYVFRWNGQAWTEQARLVAAGGLNTDDFGQAVALDGETIVVGAPRHDAAGFNVGSAFVYERQRNGAWQQVAALTPAPAWPSSRFGAAIGLHAGVVAVGAPVGGSAFPAGATFVYERGGRGGWTQVAALSDPNAPGSSQIGVSVALDGGILLVGANQFREGAGPTTGAAYVFERRPAGWHAVARLTAHDGEDGDWFGAAVGLHGRLGLVGAWRDNPNGSRSGSAYLFATGPDDDGDGLMDACGCLGDLNGDWAVDSDDLSLLIASFGLALEGGPDLNADGVVDQHDLGIMLMRLGSVCP